MAGDNGTPSEIASRRHRLWASRPTLMLSLCLTMILVLIGACSSPQNDETGQEGTSTPTATSTRAAQTATPQGSATASPISTPGGDMIALRVYFIRDEKVATGGRDVPRTTQVGTAAMEELLEGPNDLESSIGYTSSIPDGTELLGLSIDNGVATVDLSSEFESGGGSLSMRARLAQVVYTLTQFPTVDAVEFKIEGEAVDVFGGEGIVLDEPADRDRFEELTPTILVEDPTPGETISSPLRTTGTANTFEAAFSIEILDANGNALVEQNAMATSGSGTRGTFDVSVPFTIDKAQPGTLVVFEHSAKDGSRIHEIEIPIQLRP